MYSLKIVNNIWPLVLLVILNNYSAFLPHPRELRNQC